MKAVVMAGGEGSRLRPLTIGRPKPMVPMLNQPVMGHIIDLLKKHGITDIIITLQYRAEDIQEHFRDGKDIGCNIRYSVEEIPLGTAGSVKLAEDWLDETFIVISGDALTDFDLTSIIRYHNEHHSMATLTLTRVDNPLEYGVVILEEDGRVRQFQEKPSWGEVFSDTVNTGIYVLDPQIFKYFGKGIPFDFSQQLFPLLLEKGEPIYGYVAAGYWSDVGSITDYMRSNADMLEGKLKIDIPGKHIGARIWVEEDVEIAPDAQVYGPVYLGQGVKIKSGAIVRGPTVIRDFTIIDNRAAVDRSIIWRNSYVGERAELRGCIVTRQCSIKARSLIFEGAVIGDNTIIGESAVIQPNVKIWPSKEVERGATVSASIIWGNQGRRVLFGRYGVTGLVNIDITPEFAAKLGAAYGATLPKGSTVIVNRESHHTPRMIKRAIISGLPSAGVNVSDLGNMPLPVARYSTRTTENVSGGLHVRLSPFDNRVIDIRFFDKRGLDIDKNTERKIENVFFREDFRRVYLDEIGRIDYASQPIDKYTADFLKRIDMAGMQNYDRGRKLVVDYSSANTNAVLSYILDKLGCDVVALNAAVDEAKLFRTTEQFQESIKRLGIITATLDADLGVKLDTGGEKLYAVDSRGQQVPAIQLAAAVAKLILQAHGGGTIAVPVTAPSIFERIATQYGGKVIRTKMNTFSQSQAALRDGVIFSTDGEGSFIFPQFHPGNDALFAVAKILEITVKSGVRLSTVVNSLPSYALVRTKVACRWEDKGKVMRMLNEQYRNGERQVDGVRINLGDEWVLILPDADRPIFHIFAESHSSDQAQILVDKYAGLVAGLQR
ncbi:MAG: mannose-1-phosphate guanyltransferase [Chloroflexota bacterium]|nr:NTP transferase domain-containing protein [Chloroflexota bacterium]